MRKLLTLIIIIVVLFSLAGCETRLEQKEADILPEDLKSSYGEESPASQEVPTFPNQDTTREEIIAHNKQINPDDVELVQFEKPKTGDTVVVLNTTHGDIYIALYPQFAPLAVKNFVLHTDNEFYNGTEFFKVMENFYIESGAPRGTQDVSVFSDEQKNSIPFKVETHLNLWNFRGALVMRNKGGDHPNTNTSEFFIVQSKTLSEEWLENMKNVGFPEKVIEKYKEVGGIPGYDGRYTIFGQVYSGMGVVDKIAEMPVDSLYVPKEPIWITRISTIVYDENNPTPKVDGFLPSDHGPGGAGSAGDSSEESSGYLKENGEMALSIR